MSDLWAALADEFGQWRDRPARLWWRDDDAVAPTLALDRLLGLAADVPLCLAVIPANCGVALARRLEGARRIVIAQHGWAHTNHSRPAEKKSEFGAARALADCQAELVSGRDRLREVFGAPSRIFVPPWNRIGAETARALAGLGFDLLSVFGDKRPGGTGIRHLNCHVDIIDWRGDRGFIGDDVAVTALLGALRHRRETGNEGAVGILSHHLVHTPACWAFLERLADLVAAAPGAGWVDPMSGCKEGNEETTDGI